MRPSRMLLAVVAVVGLLGFRGTASAEGGLIAYYSSSGQLLGMDEPDKDPPFEESDCTDIEDAFPGTDCTLTNIVRDPNGNPSGCAGSGTSCLKVVFPPPQP